MMTQVIDVPGFGPTEFPDGMSDEQIVAAIQSNISQSPKINQPQSMFDKVKSSSMSDIVRWMTQPYKDLGTLAVEAPITMAAGAGMGIAGNIMGAGSDLYSSITGQPKVGDQVRKNVIDAAYKPRSEITKEALGKLGSVIQESKLEGLPIVGQELPMLAKITQQGIPASAEARAIKSAVRNRQSYALNQSKVSGAKDALDLKIVVDPADVNPTLGNRFNRTWADETKLDYSAAQKNVPTYNKLVREQVANDINFVPTAENLKTLSSEVAKPYRDISEQLGKVADVNGATVNALDSVRFNRNVVNSSGIAKKVNKQIDDAISKVQTGMNGSEILESISLLREEVRSIYNGTHPKIRNKKVAERYQKIADALEGHLEQGLNSANKGSMLDEYVAARRKLAEIKTVEDIVNPITGEVVPYALTKGAPSRAPLEGNLKKLRNIAANFPQATAVPTKGLSSLPNSISRTSPSGTLGTGIGLTVGQPVTGGIVGATVGMLGGKYQRGRMLSPEYQAANLIPENSGLFRTTP